MNDSIEIPSAQSILFEEIEHFYNSKLHSLYKKKIRTRLIS